MKKRITRIKTRVTAAVLSVAAIIPVASGAVTTAEAKSPNWSTFVSAGTAIASTAATAAISAYFPGPIGRGLSTGAVSLISQAIGIGAGCFQDDPNEQIKQKIDDLQNHFDQKTDEQTATLLAEYKQSTQAIIENDNKNTQKVLDSMLDLSDKVTAFHNTEQSALNDIKFKIETNDFLKKYQSVVNDYRYVLEVMEKQAPSDLYETPTSSVDYIIDDETYDYYVRVLQTSTCDFEQLKKNLEGLENFINGTDATTQGTPAYVLYINQATSYCEDQNKVTEFGKRTMIEPQKRMTMCYVDSIQAQCNMSITTLAALRTMQYECSLYEQNHNIEHNNNNFRTISADVFNKDLYNNQYGLISIANRLDEYHTSAQEYCDSLPKAEYTVDIDGTSKDFYSLDNAWRCAFPLMKRGKDVKVYLPENVTGDEEKGFSEVVYRYTNKEEGFGEHGSLYVPAGANVSIIGTENRTKIHCQMKNLNSKYSSFLEIDPKLTVNQTTNVRMENIDFDTNFTYNALVRAEVDKTPVCTINITSRNCNQFTFGIGENCMDGYGYNNGLTVNLFRNNGIAKISQNEKYGQFWKTVTFQQIN